MREAPVIEAVRHPIEAAVKKVRLEQLVPEQQPEERMPESVLREKDPESPPAHYAGDACLRIAAMGVVDGQRETGAKKLGARPGPATADFACVEIGCENEFAVARRIVDHPPQLLLGMGLFAGPV